MNIYVGNLPQATSATDLKRTFEGFGEVNSSAIINDRSTGASRGFGYVEMADAAQAEAAIASLDGEEMNGQALRVKAAKSPEDRIRRAYERSAGEAEAPRPW